MVVWFNRTKGQFRVLHLEYGLLKGGVLACSNYNLSTGQAISGDLIIGTTPIPFTPGHRTVAKKSLKQQWGMPPTTILSLWQCSSMFVSTIHTEWTCSAHAPPPLLSNWGSAIVPISRIGYNCSRPEYSFTIWVRYARVAICLTDVPCVQIRSHRNSSFNVHNSGLDRELTIGA